MGAAINRSTSFMAIALTVWLSGAEAVGASFALIGYTGVLTVTSVVAWLGVVPAAFYVSMHAWPKWFRPVLFTTLSAWLLSTLITPPLMRFAAPLLLRAAAPGDTIFFSYASGIGSRQRLVSGAVIFTAGMVGGVLAQRVRQRRAAVQHVVADHRPS